MIFGAEEARNSSSAIVCHQFHDEDVLFALG